MNEWWGISVISNFMLHFEANLFDNCKFLNSKLYNYGNLTFQSVYSIIDRPLICGVIEEVSAFEVEGFKTTIPGRLGLPQLENPCEAEGVVLRRIDFGGRVKKKTIAFREHGKQKGTKKPKQAKVIKNKVILTPEEQSLVDKASRYLLSCQN